MRLRLNRFESVPAEPHTCVTSRRGDRPILIAVSKLLHNITPFASIDRHKFVAVRSSIGIITTTIKKIDLNFG